jgi:glycosyltransferase involved in cell wall biosynthesis
MLRVLIDAADCVVGGGAAARHLLDALDRSASLDFQLTAIVPDGEGFAREFQNLRALRLSREATRTWRGRNRERQRLAGGAAGVDIYHGLTCNLPPSAVKAPVIVTSFTSSNPYSRHRAGWTPKDLLRFFLLRRRIRASLQRATHVVVHTDAARRLLLAEEPAVGRLPISVQPLAVAPSRKYDAVRGPQSCLLCPSSYLPHKNLHRLLEAYNLCARREDVPDLVIAGHAAEPYFSRLDAYRRTLPAAGRIRLLREQAAESMAGWYAGALAIVTPSYEETFSLPVMEAIASGIPVLCSDPGDGYWLPYTEFGPGPVYFPAFDVPAMSAAIHRILTSETARREAAGILRSNETPRTWNQYAGELLEWYGALVPQAVCA